jgi:hypothetical protein
MRLAATGGIDWVPLLWLQDIISSSTESIHTWTFFTFSYTPCFYLKLKIRSKRSVLLSNGPSARR